jgi:AraC-like DNA-binding protein
MTRQEPALREHIFTEDQFPVLVKRFDGGVGYRPTAFCHAELEFQLICAGEGDYFIKDKLYRFSRNSVLLIQSDEIHSRMPGSCLLASRINLIVGNSILNQRPSLEEMVSSLADCHHLVLQDKDAVVCKMLLEDISAECKGNGPYWTDVVESDLCKFLAILHRSSLVDSGEQGELNPTVKGVLDHLNSDFTSHISLDELSAKFYQSKYWLSRQFKAQTGITIMEYVIIKRIALARHLLEVTDMKVAAIAGSVGFDDLSTFNRDFKLRTGATPSDYRKIST